MNPVNTFVVVSMSTTAKFSGEKKQIVMFHGSSKIYFSQTTIQERVKGQFCSLSFLYVLIELIIAL